MDQRLDSGVIGEIGSIKEVFMIDALGGRKFIFGVLLVLCGLVLVAVNKVTGDSFLNFAMVVGATYVVGNVSATVANGIANTPNA